MIYTYTYKHTEKGKFKVVSYDDCPDTDELVLNEYELDPFHDRIKNDHAWELVGAVPPLDPSDLEAQEIDASDMSPGEIIRTTRTLQLMEKQGKGGIGKPVGHVEDIPRPPKRLKK